MGMGHDEGTSQGQNHGAGPWAFVRTDHVGLFEQSAKGRESTVDNGRLQTGQSEREQLHELWWRLLILFLRPVNVFCEYGKDTRLCYECVPCDLDVPDFS